MHVTRYRQFDSLPAAWQTDWTELARKVPFRRFDWLEAWWRNYSANPDGSPTGRHELYVLTVADDQNRLIGVAPWYRLSTRSGSKVVRFLGDGEVCSDYLSVLCRDDHSIAVTKAIAIWLQRANERGGSPNVADQPADDDRWDRLDFVGVDAEDAVFNCLLAQLRECDNLVHFCPAMNTWRMQLPLTWDEFLAGLSKQHRNRLRRADRTYFQSGQVQVKRVNSTEDWRLFFEILLDLHGRRWSNKGLPGAFASPRFTAFHREISSRWAAAGLATLAWLEMEGKPLAAEYRLHGDGVMYAYQSGMDTDRLDLRPGELANHVGGAQCRGTGPTSLRFFAWRRGIQIALARPTAAHAGGAHRAAVSLGAAAPFRLGCRAERQRVAETQCEVGQNNSSTKAEAANRCRRRSNVKVPSVFHNFLLAGYYGATMPYRLWANRYRFAHGTVPIMVLFYHRIADDGTKCCTHSNRLFQQQIRWLQKHCELISLEEVQRRVRRGFNNRLAACITFDDGYAENCEQALPFLIKHQVPCTYFVSTWHVLEGRRFAHDEATGSPGLPNTVEQIRWMAGEGIDIGAHTRTHIDLGVVTDEVKLYNEVVTSGEELQNIVGKPVRYFSFPFGMPSNLNARAFEMAYEYGYEAVARRTAVITFLATIRSTFAGFMPTTCGG